MFRRRKVKDVTVRRRDARAVLDTASVIMTLELDAMLADGELNSMQHFMFMSRGPIKEN